MVQKSGNYHQKDATETSEKKGSDIHLQPSPMQKSKAFLNWFWTIILSLYSLTPGGIGPVSLNSKPWGEDWDRKGHDLSGARGELGAWDMAGKLQIIDP